MEVLSTLNESEVEVLDTLKESTNKQKNQEVLNNLGENENGNLTYKGRPVGATTPVMVEALDDYIEAAVYVKDYCIFIETSKLPSNARVCKIEIPDVVNETDDYIDLNDMVAKDTENRHYAPYYIMFPKDMPGDFLKIVTIVIFTSDTNQYYDVINAQLLINKTIRIYYEIEDN